MKNAILFISIGFLVVVLLFLKYQKFIIIENALLFPIGISFYVFKSISYLIETQRGNMDKNNSFINCASYISFFPAIQAGPIDRPSVLIPQLQSNNKFQIDNILNGSKLIVFGLFKKCVIADRLSPFVDNVYNNPQNFKGGALLLAVFLYSFQIYFDFSGYTDIAIGSARFFGINLSKNFDKPYLSKSISEFWRRWHITLSTFLRDYIFLPIAYRMSKYFTVNKYSRYYTDMITYIIASIVTMLVAGIWHGNGLGFIIWGLLHGIYLVNSRLFDKQRKKISNAIGLSKYKSIHNSFKIVITFLLITFAWIFFRANNLNDALYVIGNLFNGIFSPGEYLKGINSIIIGVDKYAYFYKPRVEIFLVFVFIIIAAFANKYSNENNVLVIKNIFVRWSVYYILIFSVLIFGVFRYQKFIYYQF
ncbi:MAG: MBOAT family protein [Ignavibacteriae bacterium]|nr:MBOAT family protein [Ignavibacteriota bacterium]